MDNTTAAIIIQKWFRGCMFRKKHLPLIMYKIQKFLSAESFEFSEQSDDGRLNSCVDEDNIIKLLAGQFKIKKPRIRMWYDILVYDNLYGWLPVNIKTTTIRSADNTGNLAMCVYAYTDEQLDLHKFYTNDKMSKILFDKLKDKQYNKIDKKDYYFIVLNKKNSKDVIINSAKGLTLLTPNLNNLPFQIQWHKNRNFQYKKINDIANKFISCIKEPRVSWKEIFLINIRQL